MHAFTAENMIQIDRWFVCVCMCEQSVPALMSDPGIIN